VKTEQNIPKSDQHPTQDDKICRTLTMKICKSCQEHLNVLEFYFNKSKNRYFSECKKCNIKRSSSWNKKHEIKYKLNCKKHKEDNPELYKQYKRKDYIKNNDSYKSYGLKYRASQHGKSLRLSLNRKRELDKIQRCPKWLSQEHLDQIKEFYKNRPEGFHVDHIIPLRGKIVSGLHVPWNLQYLPAAENLTKRNKF
jgi:outer membrane usher protein FimD/PapC